MRHYTCKREALPLVEAALVANGHTVQLPLHTQSDQMSVLVMNPGVAIVILLDLPSVDCAAIEVYGAAQSVVGWLLETLPIPLDRGMATSAAA